MCSYIILRKLKQELCVFFSICLKQIKNTKLHLNATNSISRYIIKRWYLKIIRRRRVIINK
ncbi:hypothetical protein HanIR_Chr07g0307051 [Helianthus annuus]|nr:hypothetical protein HanIR_Chr07g0307051 [Helianthus annuus]